ncbi:MAG: hypothetical protein NC191_09965 [Muribaculaceae bacterium]|nr:hypothetical protein [Muribaculaceae bacterium]
MSASQARFLCLTARLSDNEMTQQNLTYTKQRLSENSQIINDQYLEALNKTKYQVLTGYNGTQANYADVSFNQMTGINSVACGKQYLVKDNSGKVLVSSDIAKAYEYGNGDFNKFLAKIGKGYTQSDINISDLEAPEKIHEAWDRYLASVGQSINDVDGKHILDFGYNAFERGGAASTESFDGYATYNVAHTIEDNGVEIQLYQDSEGYYKDNYPIIAQFNNEDHKIECGYVFGDEFHVLDNVGYNSETKKFTFSDYTDEDGRLKEFDILYADYINDGEAQIFESATSRLTFNGTNYTSETGKNYNVTVTSEVLNFEGATTAQRELYDYALAITEAYYNNKNSASSKNLEYDPQVVSHYKNIFNEMRTKGYTTVEEKYNVSATTASTNLKDPEWFIRQLKSGNLVLSYFSSTEKQFVGTTIDDDESIAEKEDKSAMAIAEQVYQSAMDNLEHQDKQLDLQLNRLESEHNAISNEIEAVKTVLKKNVEGSFKTFNG